MTKTENRSGKLRAPQDKLPQAFAEIASGDDWKRMLQVVSKFHRYSFNNHQVQPHSIGPPASAAISCGGSACGRKPVSSVSIRALTTRTGP